MFTNEKIGIMTDDGHELQEGDILETPHQDWGIIRYEAPSFGLTVKNDGDERIFVSLYNKDWLKRCRFIGNVNEKPIFLKILLTHEAQMKVLKHKNIDWNELRNKYITI